MKIAVVGSVNVDLMYEVNVKLKSGETMVADKYETLIGGKGLNQAVMLSALAPNVTFLGAVGSDSFKTQVLNQLSKKDINFNDLVTKDANTGLAIIEVFNKDNSIMVFPGANYLLNTSDVDTFLSNHEDIEVLVTQLETKLSVVEYLIKAASKKNIKIVLNPAPAKLISEEIIDLVDYIIPNELELLEIFKTEDIEDIVSKYKGKLIVTLGSKGVAYYEDGFKTLPAKKIKVADTTGAGDSFVAGFAAAIAKGYEVSRAVLVGIDIASITCEHFGAQSAFNKIKEEYKL